jgi:hypothetical protein
MFDDFTFGDLSQYMASKRLPEKMNLIKTNLYPTFTLDESIDTDELHKGWDYSTPYNQYLSQRRGERMKDAPLFKMVDTTYKAPIPLSYGTEESYGVKDGSDFELRSYLGKKVFDQYAQTPAKDMWQVEETRGVLQKTVGMLRTLKDKYVTDDSTEQSLQKALMENGTDDNAALVIAKALMRLKEEK